jgi:tetraacyldisaccharide 4'-kinase
MSMGISSLDFYNNIQSNKIFLFIFQKLSLIYALGIKLRLVFYKAGLFKTESIPTYVVSIGNLTTGGTGKTPFVAMLARWASRNGIRAAVLSRGYKRKKGRGLIVVSDGRKILVSSEESGDEAFMLAKKLDSVPVLVSRKRCAAAFLALKLFNSQLLVLDDGYQHLSIKRDLNILLIDSLRKFGNNFLLPAGPLREPTEEIKRADIIVLTKCKDIDSASDIASFVRKNYPQTQVLKAGHFPEKVWLPLKNKSYSPKFIRSKRIVAFAGLASPDDFFNMIKDLGGIIVHSRSFSDHKDYKQREIKELAGLKVSLNADFLLSTEKDWARINGKIEYDENLAILTIKVRLLPGQEREKKKLFRMIKEGVIQSKKSYHYKRI